MPQIFCIVEEGGRVLLSKKHGDVKTPNFPTLGLLSSLATFAENSGLSLESFNSPNLRVVYKKLPSQILFIIATSNLLLSQEILQDFLQTTYDTFVAFAGPDAFRCLESDVQIDALKRKLRALSPLLDGPLEVDQLQNGLVLSTPLSLPPLVGTCEARAHPHLPNQALSGSSNSRIRTTTETTEAATDHASGLSSLASRRDFDMDGVPISIDRSQMRSRDAAGLPNGDPNDHAGHRPHLPQGYGGGEGRRCSGADVSGGGQGDTIAPSAVEVRRETFRILEDLATRRVYGTDRLSLCCEGLVFGSTDAWQRAVGPLHQVLAQQLQTASATASVDQLVYFPAPVPGSTIGEAGSASRLAGVHVPYRLLSLAIKPLQHQAALFVLQDADPEFIRRRTQLAGRSYVGNPRARVGAIPGEGARVPGAAPAEGTGDPGPGPGSESSLPPVPSDLVRVCEAAPWQHRPLDEFRDLPFDMALVLVQSRRTNGRRSAFLIWNHNSSAEPPPQMTAAAACFDAEASFGNPTYGHVDYPWAETHNDPLSRASPANSPKGFNPLMSPTVLKQFVVSRSDTRVNCPSPVQFEFAPLASNDTGGGFGSKADTPLKSLLSNVTQQQQQQQQADHEGFVDDGNGPVSGQPCSSDVEADIVVKNVVGGSGVLAIYDSDSGVTPCFAPSTSHLAAPQTRKALVASRFLKGCTPGKVYNLTGSRSSGCLSGAGSLSPNALNNPRATLLQMASLRKPLAYGLGRITSNGRRSLTGLPVATIPRVQVGLERGSNNLQLYYKSSLDTLLSFLLECLSSTERDGAERDHLREVNGGVFAERIQGRREIHSLLEDYRLTADLDGAPSLPRHDAPSVSAPGAILSPGGEKSAETIEDGGVVVHVLLAAPPHTTRRESVAAAVAVRQIALERLRLLN